MKNLLNYLRKNSEKVFNDFGIEVEKYSFFISNEEIPSFTLSEKELLLLPGITKSVRSENEFIAFAFGKYIDKIFSSSKYHKSLIGVYEQLSQIALNLNYPEEAIEYSQQIISLQDESSSYYTKSLESIARAYRNLYNYSKSIEYYLKAKDIYIKRADKIKEIWILFHLGKMYLNYLQQPSRAGVLLLEAKEAFYTIQEDSEYKNRGIASCLDELGDLYRQSTENIDQALVQYKESLKINKKYNHEQGIARNYAHIGLSNEIKGNMEDAINYLEKSIIILRKLPRQQRGLGIRLVQLGNVYSKIQFYKKANILIDEGMQICESYRIFHYLSQGFIYKASILKQKGQVSTAINFLYKSISISTQNNINSLSSIAYKELGEVYTMIDDFSKAKDMLVKSNFYNIEGWRVVYESSPILEEVEVNNKEIAQMYKSLFDKLFKDYTETNHNTTQTISDFFKLLIQQEKDKVENLGNLFKFGALMSGIRHEVSNLLNNINSGLSKIIRIDKDMNNEAKEVVTYLKEKCLTSIALLHNHSVVPIKSINDSTTERHISTKYILPVKIKQVIESVSHYKVNFSIVPDFGNYIINCDLVSLQMILHSIILNSCESFTKSSNTTNEINISVDHSTLDYYQIIVKDNGQGIDEKYFSEIYNVGFTTKKNSSGLGLAAVKYLLESINGSIEIQSNEYKGTTVLINFKIDKNAENFIN